MSEIIPAYIRRTGIENSPAEHEWNDKRAYQHYTQEVVRLEKQLHGVANSGVLALGAAAGDWIVWRFSKLSSDPIPLQCVQAAWAAVIDPRYFDLEFDLPSKKWSGTVRGPLWALWWNLRGIVKLAARRKPLYYETVCVSNLAEHVLGKNKPFRDWRALAIDRLGKLCPKDPDDLSGPPIPREALDPDIEFTPAMAGETIAAFLRTLDPGTNPFLASAEKLRAAGFEGTPYGR